MCELGKGGQERTAAMLLNTKEVLFKILVKNQETYMLWCERSNHNALSFSVVFTCKYCSNFVIKGFLIYNCYFNAKATNAHSKLFLSSPPFLTKSRSPSNTIQEIVKPNVK